LLDPLNDNYSKKYQTITRYLITLAKPDGYSKGEYRKLRKEALSYSVQDKMLWKNAINYYPLSLVIDRKEERVAIL
jgi:hypothetical protein